MAELVRQQDGHERNGKRQAIQKQPRIALQRRKNMQILIQVQWLVGLEALRQHDSHQRGGAKRKDE